MKNNGLLCGCLAMLMVGMGFSVKTVTNVHSVLPTFSM